MDTANAQQTDRLLIFDTTLRDGEQAPGCSMTLREKLRIGQALADLGVDVIEAGFPSSSQGDFESVREIARTVHGPTICGLARCNSPDIHRAHEALKDADKSRIHVFIATSPIHREFKLQMSCDQIVEAAVAGVSGARLVCDDVEFSAEDALRTEPEFLARIVEAAIDAGATTVNIPDTVGYTAPGEMTALFGYLRKHVSNIDRAILSVHCHDDLGMAVANSLAAVVAGARQVECTINGIGERAGNCSLEEVVMAVRTRSDFFKVHTGINTRKLCPTSRVLSAVTGMKVSRNKAIVGENAFAHEAGIHQHGMIKHRETYEIMLPEDVGVDGTNLVLGKHSGRHALRQRAEELGFHLSDAELAVAFTRFKALADKKKDIFDTDLETILLANGDAGTAEWTSEALQATAGSRHLATAAVQLRHKSGKMVKEAAVGNGPIEAAFLAIELAVGIQVRLVAFDVNSLTVGEDAQGEVTVIIEYDGRRYYGKGISTDIIQAGADAFLQAVNRALSGSRARAAAGSDVQSATADIE